MRKIFFLAFLITTISSCKEYRIFNINPLQNTERINGEDFYNMVSKMNVNQRDSAAFSQIEKGNIPEFLRKFAKISVSITDSTGKKYHAYYLVSKDYVSIGTNSSWARIPLKPQTAQKIANMYHCFLPTRKIVNDIYNQSRIKLEPVPLTQFRDSSITMWQHHLIIESKRKNKKGLIAGIKKDVVISEKVINDVKPNRVAIYGWHKSNGTPIQTLYTGHVNWYVDYSHGIRLVFRIININGKNYDYIDVLKHPVFKHLICDELNCNMYYYNTE